MRGGTVVDHLGAGAAVVAEPALESVDVTVRFGGLVALSSVSVSVPSGRIVGLVGPNGAGKSTLFAVLSGLLTPTAGRVMMQGSDVTRLPAQVRARRGLTRTFQHPELFQSLSVREHLVVADRLRHAPKRRWTDLVTGRGLRQPDAAESDRVDHILELLDLGAIAHRRATGLPLGTSRFVELGRALAAAPRILLLDEPGAGLDSQESERLGEILVRMVREGDLSLLLVEHDLDLVLGVSHLVYVLDFGRRIACGAPEEIRTDRAVQEAYLGIPPAPREGTDNG